ncbi:MAG: transcriptional repressor [Prevotella sp.]|nr:transcriptional repressor [Prevotella sp.]
MDEKKCTELLTAHCIRPTVNRILTVKALGTADRPMSLSELEYKILTVDKSGIFRALTLFREHRLVHVIDSGGDGVRYELCLSHSHGEDGHDDDVHAHFYCERCHRTFCIDNVPIPEVPLPEGYIRTSVNYVLKGYCPECEKTPSGSLK